MAGLSTVLGVGSSILGARSAAKSASRDRRLRREAADRLAQVSFSPFDIGFGDAGFRGGQLQMGQFGPLANLFQDLALGGTEAGIGRMFGADEGFDERMLQNELGAFGLGQGALDFATNLQSGGFQRGLQDQLFGRAGELAGQTDFSTLRDENLELMRQLASPFEARAFQGMKESQFGMGQLGSSGGALQTEAFARGLGEADLKRQLSSIGLARDQQQQNAQIAQMFGGLGANLAGLESDLIGQAFQRFGATTGLTADLNQARFGRGQDIFNLGGMGLSGQNDIMNMLLALGTFGANLGATRANIDLGAAGGAANAVQNLGPSGADIRAGFLTSLGGSMMKPGSLFEMFSGLGRRNNTGSGGQFNIGVNNSSLGTYNPFAGMTTGGFLGDN